jgi:hypothetical protein
MAVAIALLDKTFDHWSLLSPSPVVAVWLQI